MSLKGAFANNDLTTKNKCFWSLLILFLSVASIRRKLLKKRLIPKTVGFIQIQKVATFNSDRKKKSKKFQTNHSDITNNSHRLFFDAFLFRGVLIMKTTFSYFSGMFENPVSAKYYFLKVWNINGLHHQASKI